MTDKLLKKLLILNHSSMKDAVRAIDKGGCRLAYVITKNKELIGIVTDSEIRKAILKGDSVKDPIDNIVNKAPIVLDEHNLSNLYHVKKIIRKLLKIMPDSTHILVVGKKFKVKKLISVSRFVSSEIWYKKTHQTRNKKILIVGGAGYLGSVLTKELLRKNYKVRILDSLLYGEESTEQFINNKNYELIRGDFRNLSIYSRILDGIDAVINLAAVVGDPACQDQPEAAVETNYFANKAFAEACKYHQVNRYIFASTCSVYGQMKGDDKLNENSLLNPVSLYARSKIQSEEGLLDLIDENFAPTILRMSTLYGFSPRMRFDLVVNTMVKTAFSLKKINVNGGGIQWRPFLNVKDAAKAYILCIESPIEKVKGEIFNVGSDDQNFQIVEIAKKVKLIFKNARLVINDKTKDSRNYFVSFDKISKVLHFKTTQTIENSVAEIRKNILYGKIANVNDPKYYNSQLSI